MAPSFLMDRLRTVYCVKGQVSNYFGGIVRFNQDLLRVLLTADESNDAPRGSNGVFCSLDFLPSFSPSILFRFSPIESTNKTLSEMRKNKLKIYLIVIVVGLGTFKNNYLSPQNNRKLYRTRRHKSRHYNGGHNSFHVVKTNRKSRRLKLARKWSSHPSEFPDTETRQRR
ncbi:hypothetical protein CEXT_268421 [Caerostris extrusa]|uniref:Uncharacterized protein n=1 Tax=Caerostris extrusa TaxID=172846 RepID=A0AAV4SXY0_CAEEX|nr:hypothetical protein CEXT_268421 [Caerostris extrusa]